MGYLDNSTIVVDAVLTKEGRRLLSEGQGLDIQYFTLSDSGIDYNLWNPDHPSGSAYYGEAIENLPSLEAIPRGQFYMRNKLITLNQDVTGFPYWNLNDNTNIQLIDSNNNEVGNPGANNYGGINAVFNFEQAIINSALLIVHNGNIIDSDGLVSPHTDTNYTNTVTGISDVDGTTYQALINTESENARYFSIENITNSSVALNFKRSGNIAGSSICTLIDPSSGIYATFNLEVGNYSGAT